MHFHDLRLCVIIPIPCHYRFQRYGLCKACVLTWWLRASKGVLDLSLARELGLKKPEIFHPRRALTKYLRTYRSRFWIELTFTLPSYMRFVVSLFCHCSRIQHQHRIPPQTKVLLPSRKILRNLLNINLESWGNWFLHFLDNVRHIHL